MCSWGEHIGEIRNVLSENNARTVAMQSRRESTTMMTHRWKQKSGSWQPIRCSYAGFLHLLRKRTWEGAGEDQLGGDGGAGPLGVHYQRWRRGGGGRGRNNKYNNDKDNDEDRIHVRRKVVGGVGKGLGMSGLD